MAIGLSLHGMGQLKWYAMWGHGQEWWSIGRHGGAVWPGCGWFECVKPRQVRASNQPNRHHGGSTIHYKSYKVQSWGKVRMDTTHKSPCSAQIALFREALLVTTTW